MRCCFSIVTLLIASSRADDLNDDISLYDYQPNVQPEYRIKRSQEGSQPWRLEQMLSRDRNGVLRRNVEMSRSDGQNDVQVGWSEVVGDPKRTVPSWHVGTTIRFRRSANQDENIFDIGDFRIKRSPEEQKKPWEVNPGVSGDEYGNVRGGVNVRRNFDNGHVEAGASKVFDGPGRGGKPAWHVGGSFNW